MQIGSLRIAAASFTISLLCSCTSSNQAELNLLLAERFVDAFYSWSPNALGASLAKAPEDKDRVLYYQAWAEAGNYQIETRNPCRTVSPSQAECAILVTDNIGATLGYIATDTFTLSFDGNNLVGVEFSSDDPPILQEVFGWLQATRPEVYTGPCKDLFAGGTTPQACVRAVVQGAQDYIATQPDTD